MGVTLPAGHRLQDYHSVREAAQLFQIKYQTLLAWIACGRLKSTRVIARGSIVYRHDVIQAATSPTPEQLARSSYWNTWTSMTARCRPTGTYAGVRVSWDTFEDFYVWAIANLPPKRDGDHLDRILPDGHYEPGNVQWLSPSLHAQKTAEFDRQPWATRRTITQEIADEMRRLRSEGKRIRELAAYFNVSMPTVSRVLNGHTWKSS